MFGLEVAEAWRSVRVDAAGQFFVTVQTVETLGNSVAHIFIMGTLQFRNGEYTLIILWLAFQHHRRPETIRIEFFQALPRHVVYENMMPTF